MVFVVVFFQLGRRDVRIDLSRAKRLVSEQLLHASEIGAVVEHVCGERMSQRVRADRRIEAGGREVLVELTADATGAETLPMFVDEHGVLV